ncbi:MAG: hypothetical protein ACLUTO_14545 [Anaerostipes sp.]
MNVLDTMRKPLEGAKRISGPYPYYGASGIVDYVDGYLFDEELILLSEDGANISRYEIIQYAFLQDGNILA